MTSATRRMCGMWIVEEVEDHSHHTQGVAREAAAALGHFHVCLPVRIMLYAVRQLK